VGEIKEILIGGPRAVAMMPGVQLCKLSMVKFIRPPQLWRVLKLMYNRAAHFFLYGVYAQAHPRTTREVMYLLYLLYVLVRVCIVKKVQKLMYL
jgi:hypothetical protein